ncbi:MAG: hypothetical protein A2287_04375 [Candidatus Melainabacteria bacterium RIFOXYA12_FULL_32_12]|nr:MAG: hypothetical protein A2287_04375 [Candidatus Melainabacteria bacterium RIFOXYA12_FULL_32_12]
MEQKIDECQHFSKKFYETNQAFIDKAIFAVASASIPVLINFSDKLNLLHIKTFYLFFTSLVFFTFVIILQIIACKFAKEGCDLNLGNEKDKKRANLFFDMADKIDFTVIIVFVLAISMTIMTVFTNINHKKEVSMNENKQNQEKPMEYSKTPPKSIRQDSVKDSQIPASVEIQVNINVKDEGKSK